MYSSTCVVHIDLQNSETMDEIVQQVRGNSLPFGFLGIGVSLVCLLLTVFPLDKHSVGV